MDYFEDIVKPLLGLSALIVFGLPVAKWMLRQLFRVPRTNWEEFVDEEEGKRIEAAQPKRTVFRDVKSQKNKLKRMK